MSSLYLDRLFHNPREHAGMYGYRIVYAPHKVIEDYNDTYNIACGNKVITTKASEELGVPLDEIWISELWRPYEKYIVFHELREIRYKAERLRPKEAHQKAGRDGFNIWKNDPAWKRMIREIRTTDRKTQVEKKKAGKAKTK